MSSFQPHKRATPRLCAAGCGFFGSPATQHMCSACYKKHHCVVTDGRPGASSAATASEPVGSAIAAKPAVAAPAASVCFTPAKVVAEAAVSPEAATRAQPSRCAACYRKVGLTGFVCRCGKTFCGRHRYAEEHGCAFDFKGTGREDISRHNPLIKGEKLLGKI